MTPSFLVMLLILTKGVNPTISVTSSQINFFSRLDEDEKLEDLLLVNVGGLLGDAFSHVPLALVLKSTLLEYNWVYRQG